MTRALFRHWPVFLIASLGVAVLTAETYLRNPFDVFGRGKLVYALVLAAPIFLVLSWLSNQVLLPAWDRLSGGQRRNLLLIGLAGLAAALWLTPPAEPDFPQVHTLVISATGNKDPFSGGVRVEVRDLIYLSRRPVKSESISVTPDWQLDGDIYFSHGAPGSRLEVSGEMPGGMAVYLRNLPQGGIVRITWDGTVQELDLYKRDSTVMPTILRNQSILNLPLGDAILTAGLAALYALGLAVLIFSGLVVIYQLAGEKTGRVLYWAALAGLAAFFLWMKFTYLRVDGPHAMLDSLNYVLTGEQPLTSPAFWMGIRPFTVPLATKILGLDSKDLFAKQLSRWAYFQTLFSTLCWGSVAAALAGAIRRRWLSLLAFGLELTFSLSIEVSLWDALLLSESLSFSLLALMLAGWLAMVFYLPLLPRSWMRWALVALTALVTLLYAFGRDSNGYYVLAAAVVLAAGWLINRRLSKYKAAILVYAAVALAIFAAQIASVNSGNRWQVFIDDQLAMVILKDPQATQFFVKQGLPVSDALMQVTNLDGFYYLPLFTDSPDFQPVRDWVNCCSKTAYLKYLLSDPLGTLSGPFVQWQVLLNGNIRGYRNPSYGVTPLPAKLSALSNFYFVYQGYAVVLLALLILTGVILYLRRPEDPGWIVVAALGLPILPMMYLVWYAEPMEVARHAAQVIVQLRLAGWLSLILLLGMASGYFERRRG